MMVAILVVLVVSLLVNLGCMYFTYKAQLNAGMLLFSFLDYTEEEDSEHKYYLH